MTGRAPIVDEYWYSIDWDVEAIWALDLPEETLPIADLAWHLDVPIWPLRGRSYAVTPNQVIADPTGHAAEYERIVVCDLGYPIDIVRHKGRWMILDGIHRLARAATRGDMSIQVRKVPRSAVRDL